MGRKTTLRFSILVEVDVDDWAAAYGLKGSAREVQADVRDYLAYVVREANASSMLTIREKRA